MKSAGYQQWVEVFDENISTIWESERKKELKKAAMLFGALDRELQNVREKLEEDLLQLRGKVEEKNSLTNKLNILPLSLNEHKQKSTNSKNKENQSPNANSVTQRMSEVTSPDLFRNMNNVPPTNDVYIDLSISDEEKHNADNSLPNIETSPTISSKYKKPHRFNNNSKKQVVTKENNFKQNIFQKDSDYDMSVIDCTPESDRIKTDSLKTKMGLTKKRSKRSSTLTQMFARSMKRKVKPVGNKVKLDSDSDETYYEENSDEEPMHLTDLLNYINKDEQMDTDCMEENSESSNTPNKKPKIVKNMEAEPVVRGNARKELTGFSCEKCRKFYGNMNLSPEELKKIISECSKHRYKYKPPEDTLPGFWDLSFDAPAN